MQHIYILKYLFFALLFYGTGFSFVNAQYTLPVGGGSQTEIGIVGGTVSDDGGANNYSPDYSGAVTLVPTAGNVITLTFTEFAIEDGTDFIYIFDGPNTSFPMLLCGTSGTTIPSPIQGTNPDGITILFQSDGGVELSGFQADISLSPGGVAPNPAIVSVPYYGEVTYTSCAGTVYDGGGVTCNYPAGQGVLDSDGYLIIEPSLPNHVIKIDFTRFKAEMLSNPPHPDFLRIYDGPDTLSSILGDFSDLPNGAIIADNGNFSNPSGKLTLRFFSDYIFDFEGFEGLISCVPRPEIAFLTPDTTICAGDTAKMRVEFIGTPPFSFTYTVNNITKTITGITTNIHKFDVPNLPQGAIPITITEVGDGNLPLRETTGANLFRVITVLPPPSAAFAQPTYTLCNGNSMDVAVNLVGTAPWTLVYNDGTGIKTQNNIMSSPYLITVNPTATTIMNLINVKDAQCSNGVINAGSVIVIVQDPPKAEMHPSSSGNICPGSSKQLRVDITGRTPWTLVYNDGVNDISLTNLVSSPVFITVSPQVPTTYTLKSVDAPDCPAGTVTGSASVGINVPPVVDATAYVKCTLGLGTITATGSNGLEPYQYSFDNGLTFSATNTADRPVSPNPYRVIIKDANGCKDTTTVLIPGLTAPDINSITNITPYSMRVGWTPNLSPGVRYTLRYRVNGSEGAWTIIDNITTTFRNIGGLQSNTRYEFQVLVKCTNGLTSPWSELRTAATLEGEPATCDNGSMAAPRPTGIFVNQITRNSAKLNWNSVSGPGYIIAYGLAMQNPNSWAQYVVCNEQPFSNISSYVMTNLQPNTVYRARIRTNCTNCTTALKATDDRSNWSIIIEFRTHANRIEGNELAQIDNLSLYPNPNNGSFYLSSELNQDKIIAIQISDITGRVVRSINAQAPTSDNPLWIDGNELSAGVYIVQAIMDNKPYIFKVIIDK